MNGIATIQAEDGGQRFVSKQGLYSARALIGFAYTVSNEYFGVYISGNITLSYISTNIGSKILIYTFFLKLLVFLNPHHS